MSCFLEAWCTTGDFCVYFPRGELKQKSILLSQFFLFWKQKFWISLNTILNPNKWHTGCSPVKNPTSGMVPIWQSSLCGKGAKLHIVLDIWEKLLKKMVLSGKGSYCSCTVITEGTPAPYSRQELSPVWRKSWQSNPALIHICDVTTGQSLPVRSKSMQCDFLKLSCWANITNFEVKSKIQMRFNNTEHFWKSLQWPWCSRNTV